MRRLLKIMGVAAGLLSGAAHAETTLRLVAHSDLKILDPIWTTAYIVRNHGYMIYDTLFAYDEQQKIQPQMIDSFSASEDKMSWNFVLRDGLEFHDGTAVTADDVVASLKRWAERDSLGQQMMAATKELIAVDAKTFRLVLAEPFGLVLDALAKPSSNTPFIMPKRVAQTPSNQQIGEYVGSGPFIFLKDEWKPGAKVVYAKNPRYRPRAEPASGLAGGKLAKVDRVEWVAIPDPLTAINALIAGEIDLIETLPPDLFPMLRQEKQVALYNWNKSGSQIYMRFNHLLPPFDNVKIRRAAMLATAQEDFLKAQVGDPEVYKLCNAPLVCGTAYGKEYGDLLIKPDLAEARRLLKESGYDGTPIAMLHATDLQSSNQLPPVAKQQWEAAGFKVNILSMDWQSVVSRRAKREPVAQGGWNVFFSTSVAAENGNPASNNLVSGACEKAFFGWPCDPELEALRKAFAREIDPGKQKELGLRISDRVVDQATFIWLGQYRAFGAYRKDRLAGWLPNPAAVFWNISKTGG